MPIGDEVLGTTPLGSAGKLVRNGGSGGSTIGFELDDADSKLSGFNLVNNDPALTLVLELLDENGAVLNTFSAAPGQTNLLFLSDAQKVPYTVRTDGGAAGNKEYLAFPHRMYHQDA